MDFREDQTWVGAGGKVGGIAIFGAESFEGVAVRVDSVDNSWHEVNVTSVRLGLGLGGSVGLSVFVGFNMPLLESANGLSVTDWGLNIAIPEVKVGLDDLRYGLELDKFLSGSDFLAPLFLSEMKNAERFGKLRDFASWLWSTGEFYGTGTSSDPAIMVIDVPGAGWGAEVSAFVTGGEFSCGGVVG